MIGTLTPFKAVNDSSLFLSLLVLNARRVISYIFSSLLDRIR